jgi:hypothetical protein
MIRRHCWLSLLFLATFGCSEHARMVTSSEVNSAIVPQATPPPGTPPEFWFTPTVTSERTAVAWGYYPHTTAAGSATMQWSGNRASQQLYLTIFDSSDGSVRAAAPSTFEFRRGFPWLPVSDIAHNQTEIVGIPSCGTAALVGSSTHQAWMELPIPYSTGPVTPWGTVLKTSQATAPQPGGGWNPEFVPLNGIPTAAPNSCGGGGGGGGAGGGGSPGGGSGILHCVTVHTDHYWYHPDTGQIVYRFTVSNTTCYEME